jgi:hypothetical protein
MNESLIGNKVKLFLISSISVEGVVESVSDEQIVLRAGEKYLYVLYPKKNIVCFYIVEQYQQTEIMQVSDPEPEKFEDSDLHSLALNRIESLNNFRKNTFSNLTKSHTLDLNKVNNYGVPGFIKPEHGSSEEDSTRNDSDIRNLSGLSKKPSTK